MKTAFIALALTALSMTHVNAHGTMTKPASRTISDKYRKDAYYGLRQAAEDELQYSPIQLLEQRKQADQPHAQTFDMLNNCRGTVYEEGMVVNYFQYNQPIQVEWNIRAPHPGYMTLNVVKAENQNGKIIYKNVTTLKTMSNFGTSGGVGSETVIIPNTVTGCDQPGNCALQFYWHSDLAQQTYPSCADFVIMN